MTTFTLAVVIAASIVGGLLVLVVRRAISRSTTTVGLTNVTVSREWLMRHQLLDHDR